VVINELEPDGWLTWLQNVKLDEQQARDTHTPPHPTEAAAAVLCDLLHDVKQRIIPVLPRQASQGQAAISDVAAVVVFWFVVDRCDSRSRSGRLPTRGRRAI
jgi:hypothetical protein